MKRKERGWEGEKVPLVEKKELKRKIKSWKMERRS